MDNSPINHVIALAPDHQCQLCCQNFPSQERPRESKCAAYDRSTSQHRCSMTNFSSTPTSLNRQTARDLHISSKERNDQLDVDEIIPVSCRMLVFARVNFAYTAFLFLLLSSILRPDPPHLYFKPSARSSVVSHVSCRPSLE